MTNTVGFLADGKTLLSADWRGIHLWDASTGRFLRNLPENNTRYIQSFTLSADGRIYVLAHRDGPVEIWDALGDHKLHSLKAADGFPTTHISADGKWLAFGYMMDDEKKYHLDIWDVNSGKKLHQLAEPTSSFLTYGFSPDGKTLVAVGADDGPAHFWDVVTGQQVLQFPRPAEVLMQIALSPERKFLAVVPAKKWERKTANSHAIGYFSQNHVLILDARAGTILHKLQVRKDGANPSGFVNGANTIAFAPDGKLLIATMEGVQCWDPASGREITERFMPAFGVTALGFSADGRTMATGGGDQTIRIWEVSTGKEQILSGAPIGPVMSVIVAPDSQVIATGGHDRIIRLWDPRTGKERGRLVGHTGQIDTLAYSPDGKMMISTGNKDMVRIWDVASRTQRRELPGSSALLAPDGKTLIVAEEKKPYVAWDLATNQSSRQLPGDHGKALPKSFTSDRTCVTWGFDNIVSFCDRDSGKVLRQLPGHHFADAPANGIYCVAFAPNGNQVASGGHRGEIALHDLATGQVIICNENRHAEATSTLAFSLDSQLLASGDLSSGTIHLWEAATGQELERLVGHQGRVTSLAFSPDGKLLVSGSEDTTALVWDLAAGHATPSVGAYPVEDLQTHWANLSSANAQKARQAMAALTAKPEQTLPLLRRLLTPIAPIDDHLAGRLVTDLEKEDFRARESASKQLMEMGEAVELKLRRALETTPAPETDTRLSGNLGKAHPGP